MQDVLTIWPPEIIQFLIGQIQTNERIHTIFVGMVLGNSSKKSDIKHGCGIQWFELSVVVSDCNI